MSNAPVARAALMGSCLGLVPIAILPFGLAVAIVAALPLFVCALVAARILSGSVRTCSSWRVFFARAVVAVALVEALPILGFVAAVRESPGVVLLLCALTCPGTALGITLVFSEWYGPIGRHRALPRGPSVSNASIYLAALVGTYLGLLPIPVVLFPFGLGAPIVAAVPFFACASVAADILRRVLPGRSSWPEFYGWAVLVVALTQVPPILFLAAAAGREDLDVLILPPLTWPGAALGITLVFREEYGPLRQTA